MQLTAQQIASLIGGRIVGNASAQVCDVSPVESSRPGTLTYVTEDKYLPALANTQAAIVLISESLYTDALAHNGSTLIVVSNARQAIGQLLQGVADILRPRKRGIEQPIAVADGVQIPEDAYVGAFAYIGSNVRIGKGVQIYPQVYIGDNVTIGDDTILYAGTKIYDHCTIGSHCIIHSGCVIGADGFGFEPDAQRVNHKIPQIGTVVIEDDVEIGANTTIDRAMMGETRVCQNTKIDNLVQVAHNVHVGDSTFLCAQVGIAGSTQLGKHCIMAGQVGVAGHLTIADDVVCGAQAGVAGSIRKAGQYQGAPAIDAMQWRRASVVFKNLPQIQRQLNDMSVATHADESQKH